VNNYQITAGEMQKKYKNDDHIMIIVVLIVVENASAMQ